MSEKVGMPTMTGFKGAMIDFGVGMGGGVLYAISASLLGSGLLGGLIGTGLAGATLKGARGTAIATILGFQTIVGSAGQAASAQAAPRGTM